MKFLRKLRNSQKPFVWKGHNKRHHKVFGLRSMSKMPFLKITIEQ